MTLDEFNKEMERRAILRFKEIVSAANKDARPTQVMIVGLCKDIAAIQMVIEQLVEHTKMPKLDEK